MSADDQRRFRELLSDLEETYTAHSPDSLCVEVYNPYKGSGKAAACYGGVCFWAHARKLPVLPAVPQDVKRGVCGKVSASKGDVQKRILELVPSLREAVMEIIKGQREHVVDAGAHAYLGLQELWEMRQMVGMEK